MDIEDMLRRLAIRAVRELKSEGKWDGHEEGLAHKYGADPETSRAIILYILRGESPQAIIVEFGLDTEWKKSIARAYVNEIKRQVTAFFSDNNRHDWPEGFSIGELNKAFPRLFARPSPDEKLCLDTVVSKFLPEYLSYEHLTAIFERPSQSLRRALSGYSLGSRIDESSAVNYLGARIVCGSCPHATILKYATIEAIANQASRSVLQVSIKDVLEAIKRFKCQKCSLKTALLAM